MNDANVLRQATTQYQDDAHQGNVPVDLWIILSRSPKWQQLNNEEAGSSKKRFSAEAEVEVDDTIGSSQQRSPFNVDDSDDEEPIPRPIEKKKAKSTASGSRGSGSVFSDDDIEFRVKSERSSKNRNTEKAKQRQYYGGRRSVREHVKKMEKLVQKKQAVSGSGSNSVDMKDIADEELEDDLGLYVDVVGRKKNRIFGQGCEAGASGSFSSGGPSHEDYAAILKKELEEKFEEKSPALEKKYEAQPQDLLTQFQGLKESFTLLTQGLRKKGRQLGKQLAHALVVHFPQPPAANLLLRRARAVVPAGPMAAQVGPAVGARGARGGDERRRRWRGEGGEREERARVVNQRDLGRAQRADHLPVALGRHREDAKEH
ncbi:unnamed protein product [Cuscuta campestris]|uniref:Uncharacterized protein n=1 Tax=Cuscuta campestris TaxID=132261 RepID=A0A484KXC1_9ASTE|nr:unnamed protein product [Cuscuta campestris]